VRAAFSNVSAVDAGKSGGRSNVPVKSEMLIEFTPDDPLAASVKMSKESSPIGIGVVRAGSEAHNPRPNKTINCRFTDAPKGAFYGLAWSGILEAIQGALLGSAPRKEYTGIFRD
jgi:hypothetical protein